MYGSKVKMSKKKKKKKRKRVPGFCYLTGNNSYKGNDKE